MATKKFNTPFEKEWNKELQRIKRFIKQAEQRGYSFPSNITPPKPQKVTQKSIQKIKSITPETLYKKSTYTIPETGQIVSGTTGRQIERTNSAIKAQQSKITGGVQAAKSTEKARKEEAKAKEQKDKAEAKAKERESKAEAKANRYKKKRLTKAEQTAKTLEEIRDGKYSIVDYALDKIHSGTETSEKQKLLAFLDEIREQYSSEYGIDNLGFYNNRLEQNTEEAIKAIDIVLNSKSADKVKDAYDYLRGDKDTLGYTQTKDYDVTESQTQNNAKQLTTNKDDVRERFYKDRTDKGTGKPPSDTFTVIYNLIEIIDKWEPNPGWSEWRTHLKEGHKNTLKSMLYGAINSDGFNIVAQRLEATAHDVIRIANEIMYGSDQYAINMDFSTMANILKGGALTQEESMDITDLAESYETY